MKEWNDLLGEEIEKKGSNYSIAREELTWPNVTYFHVGRGSGATCALKRKGEKKLIDCVGEAKTFTSTSRMVFQRKMEKKWWREEQSRVKLFLCRTKERNDLCSGEMDKKRERKKNIRLWTVLQSHVFLFISVRSSTVTFSSVLFRYLSMHSFQSFYVFMFLCIFITLPFLTPFGTRLFFSLSRQRLTFVSFIPSFYNFKLFIYISLYISRQRREFKGESR